MDNFQKCKNVLARFMDQTNKGAVSEETFVAAWENVEVAMQSLCPRMSGEQIHKDVGAILHDLCAATHPVNEETGIPYAPSKWALMDAFESAARSLCGLIAIGGAA